MFQAILIEVVLLLLWRLDGEILMLRIITALAEAETVREIARKSKKKITLTYLDKCICVVTTANKMMVIMDKSMYWMIGIVYIGLPLLLGIIGFQRYCDGSILFLAVLCIHAIAGWC